MENTIKNKNWFVRQYAKFKDWKDRTGKKLDNWSKKKPFRRKLYLNRSLYLMMAPFIILFTLFTVVPVVMSLVLSLTYYNVLEAPRFIGFDNFLTLFLDDDIFILAVKNTLILAVITGPIGYLLAF